jgi:CheY-like chemotaxis protein
VLRSDLQDLDTMSNNVEAPSIALLVEDDRDLRSLEVALIEESDLRTVEAESTEEALSYLEQHGCEVALLITDARLPGSDGVELARKVSQRWPWVRIVVTSSDPSSELQVPQSARYMAKPWLALEVLMEADRAARRASFRQQVIPQKVR